MNGTLKVQFEKNKILERKLNQIKLYLKDGKELKLHGSLLLIRNVITLTIHL